MNWINVAWIAGGLFVSLIVGLIIGRVAASIKYPDPDKTHVFSPKQMVILLCAVLAAVVLIVFAVIYRPKPKDPNLDNSMNSSEMGDLPGGEEPGDMGDGDLPEDTDGGDNGDTPADGTVDAPIGGGVAVMPN